MAETKETWKIVFQVGIESHNLNGNYRVLSVNGDKMDVLYLDGRKNGIIQTLDIAGQIKHLRNEHAREESALRMSTLPFITDDESFTLGYLAQHAMIFIRVKSSRQQWFEETYRKLTGTQPPLPNIEGNYYTVSSDEVEGSWDYWHVMFPAPHDEVKPHLVFSGDPERHVFWDQWGQFSKYNDRNYVLNLFRMGFRMGKHHEIDVIRSKVGKPDLFDEGFFCPAEMKKVA